MADVDLRLCELDATHYTEIVALWARAGLPAHPTGRDAPHAFAAQLAGGQQRAVGLRTAGGELVAVAVLTHDGRKGWINRLAVAPGRRRQGLARRLIAEAERWFHEAHGIDVWAALIAGQNAASQALFAEAGYEAPPVVYVSKRARPDA